MDKGTFITYFGYFASGMIALSMLMSNIKRLRLINLFGAASFATYGFLMQAMLLSAYFVISVGMVVRKGLWELRQKTEIDVREGDS